MKPGLTLLLLSLAATHLPAAGATHPLVDQEHAFASAAAARGISPAFTEFMAEDGYIFRPLPVLGRKFHATNQLPGHLVWEPEFSVLSADGDLGFTTGPWKYYTGAPNGDAAGTGHYFSVWRRNAAEGWKVVADIGISHPPLPLEGLAVETHQLKSLASSAENHAQDTGDEAVDAALRSVLSLNPPPIGARTRLLRDGEKPFVGPAAIEAAITRLGRLSGVQPAHHGISRCGTFLWIHGRAGLVRADGESVPASPAVFLQVWTRQDPDGWQLAAEIVLPVAPDRP